MSEASRVVAPQDEPLRAAEPDVEPFTDAEIERIRAALYRPTPRVTSSADGGGHIPQFLATIAAKDARIAALEAESKDWELQCIAEGNQGVAQSRWIEEATRVLQETLDYWWGDPRSNANFGHPRTIPLRDEVRALLAGPGGPEKPQK